jgi:ParB/RepB/Spo0J family partition protein
MTDDIRIELIDRDAEQPRQYFDDIALRELADSMSANGLAQPILLRPVDGGRYVIVHGERRYRAAKLLGWSTIPAQVRQMTIEEARVLALIENVQRADLSPIEEARAYQVMLDQGMTQAELGAQIGKSQSHIATKLRLLRMPAGLQLLLDRGSLSEGHVKQILRLDAFYNGERVSTWQDVVNWHELATDKDAYVEGFIFACRPLDKWFFYIMGPAVEAVEHDAPFDALQAQYNEVQGVDDWPVWYIPALWFALEVHYHKHAVTELKDIIDKFMAFVVNAAMYLQTRGKPTNGINGKPHDYDVACYFGAMADLRHAGLSSWADKDGAGRQLYREGSPAFDKRFFDWQSFLLPTSVQWMINEEPSGPIAKRHNYLKSGYDYDA